MTDIQLKKPFRLAVVTGASSGIGEALCHVLARNGIDLFITGRNTASLNYIADSLRTMVTVATLTADLANPQERAHLIKKIHELSPDLVINNAGFGLYGDALTFTTSEQQEIVDVNVSAVLDITLETARTLVSHNQKGIIVNVSSAGAFQPFPNLAVYVASKSFVNSFTESLDEEMKPYGVRVLAACPGQVATKFRLRASQGNSISEESTGPVMTATFAAEEIWKQIQSKKTIHIFDWTYRLGIFITRYLLPRSILNRILKKSLEGRYLKRPIIKLDPE